MKLILSILFCSILFSSLGQSIKIDSLQILSNEVIDKIQVDVINELSFELLSYDNQRAKANAEKAYQLSNEISYEKGKATALIFMGVTEFIVGNQTRSFLNIKTSVSISKKIKAYNLQAYGLTYLGSNFESTNQMDSALLCFNEAYTLLKDINEPYYLSFLYLHLADYYKIKNQPDLQLDYLKKCWAVRQNLKEKKYLVWAGQFLASYYIEHGDYKESFSYLKQAQAALAKDTVDNEEISFIYKQRAIIEINKGNYSQAFDLLTKAKKYFERNSDKVELIDIQSEIGYIFMDIANYELALKNYFEALSRAEKYGYELAQTKLLFRIAWVYYQLKQDRQSEEYIKKSLVAARTHHHKAEQAFALNLLGLMAERQNKINESVIFFNEALGIRRSINHKNGVASTLLNIGTLLEKEGKYSEALKHYTQSLTMEESSGHNLGKAYCYQGLGQLYIKMKDFKKADFYLSQATLLSQQIKAGNLLVEILKNKRELLLAQKKYAQAIIYSIQYDNLKDSIFNQNISNRISTLQNIFQFEQKENKIIILNQYRELQQKKLEVQDSLIRQQEIIIIVGGIGFFILCLIAFVIYKYYSKVKALNKEISESNEEIQAQAEELTESNQELSKLNREIQERNEEISTQAEELIEGNESLVRLNIAVNEKNEEIQAQAEELIESNQVISNINNTLEERIEERTAELKQAYKELDTFFYRSSHDFRRPLTTFMGLAEVAKITVKDTVALELFNKVNETAHNLDKMLMKLQSISDLGVQESLYKEIIIHEFFQQKLDTFNSELLQKNIKIKVEVDQKLSFQSYPALVKIILVNLIENAIAFRGFHEPFILLKAYQKDNCIVVEVIDNGQGIEPDLTSRVFDMYYRGSEHSKGNGLGLYIVKKAADKLKATINLESEVGKGSKISIFFPTNIG